jgi:hypothetical protein
MNPYLAAYMVVADKWYACPACQVPQRRLLRLLFIIPAPPPSYLRLLRMADPWALQLLSTVDIGFTLQQRFAGPQAPCFMCGHLVHATPLDFAITAPNDEHSPDGHHIRTTDPATREVYRINKAHNPILQQHLCMYERPTQQPGLPLLFPRAIAGLANHARDRAVIPDAAIPCPMPHLVVGNAIPGTTATDASVFNIGTRKPRRSRRNDVPMLVTSSGLPTTAQRVCPFFPQDPRLVSCMHYHALCHLLLDHISLH